MLTIGFARRLATYKRLNLLLQDVERAMRARRRRPADPGRCSPARRTRATTAASGSCRSLFAHASTRRGFADRVAYLDDYDLRMAARLVRGCDVWINLPRPPLEASAARRGMKNVVNGGLQLSVLDGWWAEGYDGAQRLGAVAATSTTTTAPRTRATPHELFRLLEEEVAPEFYARGGDGIPRDWVARVRRSLRTLGPGVRRRADARGLRDEGLHAP